MAAVRSYVFDVSGKGLRALYSDISERIVQGITDGERRFHAMFPPGTDRGRIVSYILSRTRLKTVIISPNAARRQYWKARRAQHADLYDAAASTWTNVPGQMVSTNPYSCAPVLTLTYKQLSESRTAGQEREAVKRFTTHATRQGYKLVILDECTDLPAAWQKELQAFIIEANAAVVGFSSHTPDASSAWYAHCSEAVKLEVPVTVAALQGALVPYRHHAVFQPVPVEGDSPDRLMQGSEKIAPAVDIIVREARMHGHDARLAILMDTHALTHVRKGGLLDGMGLLKAIIAQSALTALTPAMLTGASIIVPAEKQADTIAAIQREIRLREWDMGLQLRSSDVLVEIAGEGRDWNSAVYVELVRALLRQGLAGCVLFAPEVLSWGIQALPFNTLIDLTSDVRQRYVHVPENPSEVAVKTADACVNYWDVVCISPSGGADWERLMAKHAATECPTEEHVIEIGPGAVDMRLPAMNPVVLYESTDAWNAGHLERSVHRKDWARIWKSAVSTGMPAESAVVVPWEDFSDTVHAEAAVRDMLAEDARLFSARKATMKLHHTLWTVAAVSAALIAFLTLSREMAVYASAAAILILLVKIITKWWSVRGARPRIVSVPREEFLARAAYAVYAAFCDASEDELPLPADAVQVSAREDGSYRVLFSTPSPEPSALCRAAFAELFSSQPPPGYILAVYAFDSGKQRLQTVLSTQDIDALFTPQYWLPVPSFFAQSKAHAEVFRGSWDEFVGKSDLHNGTDALTGIPAFRERCPASVRMALCRG